MVIESFSQKVIQSGILKTYVAAGFFATLVFFVINSHLFTPMQMLFWTIIATVGFKGLSNIMFSLIILLFDFKGKHNENQYKLAEDKLDLLIHDIQMKEAQLKSEKFIKDDKS
jgi:hypothetical protein